jgi:hypothetical protein
MSAIYVYSREGCHLCDVLLTELRQLVDERLPIEVRDIDSNAAWHDAYFIRIPVVEFAGQEVCHYQLDRAAISAILAAQL